MLIKLYELLTFRVLLITTYMQQPTYKYQPRAPHTRYDTRVIINKPWIYIAEFYTIWIAQLVKRKGVNGGHNLWK